MHSATNLVFIFFFSFFSDSCHDRYYLLHKSWWCPRPTSQYIYIYIFSFSVKSIRSWSNTFQICFTLCVGVVDHEHSSFLSKMIEREVNDQNVRENRLSCVVRVSWCSKWVAEKACFALRLSTVYLIYFEFQCLVFCFTFLRWAFETVLWVFLSECNGS